MVNDEVREVSGSVGANRGTRFSGQQVLCIGCPEKRIGRTLMARDFTDAPVNDLEGGCYRSERLLDRSLAQTGASGSQAGLAGLR
jgi:hypothetical protein